METNTLKLRWLNDACYEVKLPNGKTILVDPYLESSNWHTLTSADVEGADYILISHTHFDHIMELGTLARKFQSKVFVGSNSGVELARLHDLPGRQIYLCGPGETFYMEDLQLECFRGKHSNLGDMDIPSKWPENIVRDGIDPRTQTVNMLGSYEYVVYLITLPDHTRLLIWGGGVYPETLEQAKRFHPNLSIAQYLRQGPEAMVELYSAIGGQYIFPHHHDPIMAADPAWKETIRGVAEQVALRSPGTTVLNPRKGVWYTVYTGVREEP